MNGPLTRSDRELLKAIYRLTKGTDFAHTGALAEALGVVPGTVTASVKRLAERALLEHHPYRGVELTGSGRLVAVAAIRRHRIVERFLSDMLGYPYHEADRLAGTFEYELPDEVEERMFVALDRPETCPHGFPIPAAAFDAIPLLPALTTLEAGERAVVAVPGSTQPDVVAFLETLGLRPGVTVEVRERHPFDGPLVLRVDGVDRTVGHQLAAQINVSDIVKTTLQPQQGATS
jgi:DtxR family transcriptional regulator, Mn-dependent transcriptional regulator